MTITSENGVMKIIKGYWYVCYETNDLYFEALLEVSAKNRHGFELIAKNRKCNLYFDLEKLCNEEDEEATILRILGETREYLTEEFQGKFEFHVTRGSRVIDGVFKGSFHLVVTGIVYKNNHGGAIMKCASDIQARPHEKDKWIDLSVYKKDGLMRTILSCKRGETALRNVTGDGFSKTESVFSKRVYEDCDVGVQGTLHDNSGGKIVYVKNDSVACVCDSSVTKLGTKRKKCSDDSIDIRTEYLPDDVTRSLQEMVDKNGGRECVVS